MTCLSLHLHIRNCRTLSLVPDIPIFMNAIGLDTNGLHLAKAGRVVRSGTRTCVFLIAPPPPPLISLILSDLIIFNVHRTRLLRMLRLVRMVRIVRLFKLNKFFKRLLQNKDAFEESDEEEHERKGMSYDHTDIFNENLMRTVVVDRLYFSVLTYTLTKF